jgi:ketosteroid isomerase-like protein
MRSLALVLMIASLGFPPSACSQSNSAVAQLPSVTLPPALDRVLRDYETAWRAQDAPGLSQLFADGRVVMTNSGRAVHGRDAVRQAYATGGGPLVLRATSYAMDDTVAHIIGAYAMRPGDGDAGTFVLALVRSPGGKWLIAADMDRAIRR